jgi:hypothetical protein
VGHTVEMSLKESGRFVRLWIESSGELVMNLVPGRRVAVAIRTFLYGDAVRLGVAGGGEAENLPQLAHVAR